MQRVLPAALHGGREHKLRHRGRLEPEKRLWVVVADAQGQQLRIRIRVQVAERGVGVCLCAAV